MLIKIDFEVLRAINDLYSFNWIIVKTFFVWENLPFCQLPWTNQWIYQNSNQEIQQETNGFAVVIGMRIFQDEKS